MNNETDIKRKTVGTLKWNSIDRFSSQILYAVTGVILANVLPKEDFGLVGAILVFQAFATIFVDSGFGSALLQKKQPDNRDYSTVFWFNLIVAGVLYIVLYFCAPLLAYIFQKDARLIPLSRVMFLSFVINGLGIVQTNLLMKAMTVKRIAVSNLTALTISGAAGIWLALAGWGAWALVWQTIVMAVIRTGWLWIASSWRPQLCFSPESLKSIYRVGLGVFSTSFLNTVFLNIYPFIIGAWYSLTALGDYTQADKWSKMGSASLSQIFMATFVPLLSRYQDDREQYLSTIYKLNRLTAFMVFPFMGGLAVMAPAIFHTLFGAKWDSAIVLFQILVARGALTVMCSLYNNYLLSLGYARTLVIIEIVKDVATLAAIGLTIWTDSLKLLVWGQLGAGAATWFAVLAITSRATGYNLRILTCGMSFYLFASIVAMAAAWLLTGAFANAMLELAIQAIAGFIIYLGILSITKDPMLKEAKAYIFKKK
ncbi:MAG: lipopolysaccharide biosynthesis protein [Prevotella sp.]|nr:lipopolysaccharide biosynthesis protein [Prevotella sp.]MCM1074508.1 lipopolysaccharide biosynthesis protein [Ruminococcus sp.]